MIPDLRWMSGTGLRPVFVSREHLYDNICEATGRRPVPRRYA